MTRPRNLQLAELIIPAKLARAGSRQLPVLSMTMKDGLVDQGDKFKKRIASIDTAPYKVVTRNQLVVGFPIDEGVLSFQSLYDEAIVSPAYDVWDLKGEHEVYPPYLQRYLRSMQALHFYRAKLRGTTARRRTLPDDVFLSMEIPLPTISEQRRIASILEKADVIQRKRRHTIDLMNDFLRSVFLQMFGDPVTNSKNWPTKKLGEIGDIVTGNTPSRANPEFYGSFIEWIKSDNINTPAHYLTRATEFLSEKGKTVGRTVPKGSVLVTCIAGSPACIGNSAIADREVAFNQQINAIVPHKECNAKYLYALFLVGKKLIQGGSTNSMKKMVSKSKFENIEIPLPHFSLQMKFAEQFDLVNRILEKFEHSASYSKKLNDSLAARLFQSAST